MKIIAVVIGALLSASLLASPATAGTRGRLVGYRASLAPVHTIAPMPVPSGVTIIPTRCPASLSASQESACTYSGGPIYIADEAPHYRQTLRHEYGHHVDYQLDEDPALAARVRGRFMALLDLKGAWRNPPNSPHEKFAEAWSLCDQRIPWWGVLGGYNYQATRRVHRKVCALLRTIPVR